MAAKANLIKVADGRTVGYFLPFLLGGVLGVGLTRAYDKSADKAFKTKKRVLTRLYETHVVGKKSGKKGKKGKSKRVTEADFLEVDNIPTAWMRK